MESTQVIGVVPVEAASQVRRRLALSPILGVPAVIWAAHNLRRVLPPAAVVIVSDDPEVADLARSQCVEPLPESADLDPQRLFVHDPAQPFCSAETIRLALSRGAREVSVVQTSVIERLRLEQESDLELLTAVAAGLAPDHPCMQGVRRLRLGLAHAARPFRAVITDVDGVLTDARTTFDDEGVESRAFHMHDGMGTTLLRKADYRIGWLSATRSGGGAAKHRAAVLSVDAVDIGPGDKAPRFTAMCEKLAV
ncbi:MAG: hypothetical protein VYC34_01825, partial [Planctomycetota bacterium]|nr:hypothetical protein [Planctomycetota bacterium]